MADRAHTRRNLLRTAAVAGVAATAVAAPTAAAAKRRGTPTFVFVSGASGGPSGEPELTLRGYRTVGVELPGHGLADAQYDASYQAPQDLEAFARKPSPMAGVTLDDYEAATVAVIRRVARFGPVIVVGSSAGGATLNRVGNAVPQLIDHLVYDTAFCPAKLRTIDQCLAAPEGSTSKGDALLPALVGDPAAIGALRFNYRLGDPEFLAGIKEALAGDSTDAEFYQMLNALQPDETLAIGTSECAIVPERWGRIPRTYIRHTADAMIPLALQDRMIREADELTTAVHGRRSRFAVRDLATAHVTSRATWPRFVDLLDGIARRL
jgi:pimeloyl-ACP methyl ester carboxylesterase